MKKIVGTTLVALGIVFSESSYADVAVSDTTVRSNTGSIKTNTENTKNYIGPNTSANGGTVNENLGKNHGTTYSSYGVTVKDKGSVRANQVKQMDIMQGDRKKAPTSGSLKLPDAKERDYLNKKPGANEYAGGSGYTYAGSTVNLPDAYCASISVSTSPTGVKTYSCSGTNGYVGSAGINSKTARKNLIVDFSSKSKNDILEETEAAAELHAQKVAIYQAMAQEAYYNAVGRYKTIQGLQDEIKNSKDPKDIMDLQARIQSEQVMLQNEQNQLLALGQLQQSERDMYEQRKIELNSFRKTHDTAYNSAAYNTKKPLAIAGIGAMNTALITASDSATIDTALAAGLAGAALSAFY